MDICYAQSLSNCVRCGIEGLFWARVTSLSSLQNKYIAPDEPLEARRKRIFDRKKAAAVRDGKEVEVMDNVLVVNGIEVYSMKVGFIACNDG